MSAEKDRAEVRVPVNFKVDYIHGGDFALSFSKNISLGGMFLCTPEPPEPGSILQLIFSVEEYYQAEITAVVIWVNNSDDVGEIGMGVQFLSPLYPNLKENIMKQIKRVVILNDFEGFA